MPVPEQGEGAKAGRGAGGTGRNEQRAMDRKIRAGEKR